MAVRACQVGCASGGGAALAEGEFFGLRRR